MEKRIAALAPMRFEELSPLLTLLDWILGHKSTVAPLPVPTEDDKGIAAKAALSSSSVLHAHFLRSAMPHLESILSNLGLRLCIEQETNDSFLCIRDHDAEPSNMNALSRAEVCAIAKAVEERISDPAISLATLQPVAERVMELCIEVITASDAAKNLDLAAVRRCRVAPGAFFDEDWSIGLETAWQASGAEGILTMPNYTQWTMKHAAHRAKSRNLLDDNGESRFPWGRLWRLERWSCMQAPCHEVIHLVQHVARDAIGDMNIEAAEHDGSFSTCLLMLAVALHEQSRRSSRGHGEELGAGESEGARGADKHITRSTAENEGGVEGGAEATLRTLSGIEDVYYPGAVEEALLEIAEFVGRMHRQDTAEAAERWDAAARSDYMRWRDAFGSGDMSDCWGTGGNFGGDLQREALCKQILALEAVCPRGRLLTDATEIRKTAEAMLTTMFAARARARAQPGSELVVASEVDLKELRVDERLAALFVPLGRDGARVLCTDVALHGANAHAGSDVGQ